MLRMGVGRARVVRARVGRARVGRLVGVGLSGVRTRVGVERVHDLDHGWEGVMRVLLGGLLCSGVEGQGVVWV